MPRKATLHKTKLLQVRLTAKQRDKLFRAAQKRTELRGEVVSVSALVREAALQLAGEILSAA